MSQQQENTEMMKENLSRIKRKYIVLSGKGGVGKSTVSVNLAATLNLLGKKVGILDVDIHGPSIAKMTGLSGKRLEMNKDGNPVPLKIRENFYVLTIAALLESDDTPVVWRGPLKMTAIKQFLNDIQWPELDYLIIDCPPGTGDEPLSAVQLIGQVDGSIIVSTPQEVAFLDARKTINFSKMFDPLSYLYIVKAINTFNLSRGYDSLHDAITRIKAQTHLISFKSDYLFFPSEMEHIAKMLKRNNQPHSYLEVDSDYGHDAFLVELDKFDWHIKNILEA